MTNDEHRYIPTKSYDDDYHDPPVVDQPTFDAIECNRCGYCCKRITFEVGDKGALGLISSYAATLGTVEDEDGVSTRVASASDRLRWFEPQDAMIWMGNLIPSQDEDGEWTYRCGYYSDDVGCTIYENRPEMCRTFPNHAPTFAYGKNRGNAEGCTWDVEIMDYEIVQGVDMPVNLEERRTPL